MPLRRKEATRWRRCFIQLTKIFEKGNHQTHGFVVSGFAFHVVVLRLTMIGLWLDGISFLMFSRLLKHNQGR